MDLRIGVVAVVAAVVGEEVVVEVVAEGWYIALKLKLRLAGLQGVPEPNMNLQLSSRELIIGPMARKSSPVLFGPIC